MERGEKLGVDRGVTDHPPGVEQREEKLRVVGLEPGKVGQLADLVSNHQVQIPQRMQKPAQERLIVGADRPCEQDEDVDIGMEREVPASVPAEGEDRDLACGHRRLEEQALQQRVDTIRVPLRRDPAGGPLQRVLNQFLASGFERSRGADTRPVICRLHGSSWSRSSIPRNRRVATPARSRHLPFAAADVTKLRLKPPSIAPRSVRESS